jgi:hypothetical protein
VAGSGHNFAGGPLSRGGVGMEVLAAVPAREEDGDETARVIPGSGVKFWPPWMESSTGGQRWRSTESLVADR